MRNILVISLLITISGCSVSRNQVNSPHSIDDVYERVNQNTGTPENLNQLRHAFMDQLARKTNEAPGGRAIPQSDPDILIPVTILPVKVKGRTAARDKHIEYRLYKKGGIVLQ